MILPTPDWTGQTAVLVASGPSAAGIDYSLARGHAKFAAINDSWRLMPWADVLYACDFAWWKRNLWCPEFHGLKVGGDARCKAEGLGLNSVTVLVDDRLHFEELGIVGRGGGSSGFQLINMVLQWNPAKLILCGFDCRIDAGLHWHGAHAEGKNPHAGLVEQWRRALDGVSREIEKRGVTVINCSATSALRNYRKLEFREALTA